MKISRIFLVAMVLAAFIGCSPNQNLESLKFSGTLELTEHSLGAKVAGRLVTLLTDEGQEVKTGQLLATLDRFDQARKDYERLEQLFKVGGTTEQALEYAELNFDDQRIVSPIDGIVLVKVHEVGETVAAGSAVMVVGDRTKLWVRIFVPEGVINKVYINQSAVLHFDGLQETFKGHVSFIATQAEFTPRNVQTTEERVTQTFAVKVTLDEPPVTLRPGIAADVELNLQ